MLTLIFKNLHFDNLHTVRPMLSSISKPVASAKKIVQMINFNFLCSAISQFYFIYTSGWAYYFLNNITIGEVELQDK